MFSTSFSSKMEDLDQLLESLEHANRESSSASVNRTSITTRLIKPAQPDSYIEAMHKLVTMSTPQAGTSHLEQRTSLSPHSSSSNLDLTELDDLLDDLYQAKVSLVHKPNDYRRSSSSSSSYRTSHDPSSSSSLQQAPSLVIKPSSSSSSSSSPTTSTATTSSSSPPGSVVYRLNTRLGGGVTNSKPPFYDNSPPSGYMIMGRSSAGGLVNDSSSSPSSSSSASLGSSLRPISERTPGNMSGHSSKPVANTAEASRELEDLMNSLTMYKKDDRDSSSHQHRISSSTTTGRSSHTQALSSILGRKPSNSLASSDLSPSSSNNRSSVESPSSRNTFSSHRVSNRSVCGACQQPIIGQVITALGSLWHPEHFRCRHCDCAIGTSIFYEKDNQPYCERDYLELFSPKCAQCTRPILDKMLTALDKPWHIECFACQSCKKPLNDESFLEINQSAYCKKCYENKLAPKCKRCEGAIVDHFISALDAYWHPSCFVCQECGSPFNSSSFFEYNSMPYCELHYHLKRGSLCASCQQPINGRCVTAMNKKFHPEHFVCSFCQRHLNKGTFKENNDKPFCHACFQKLFL